MTPPGPTAMPGSLPPWPTATGPPVAAPPGTAATKVPAPAARAAATAAMRVVSVLIDAPRGGRSFAGPRPSYETPAGSCGQIGETSPKAPRPHAVQGRAGRPSAGVVPSPAGGQDGVQRSWARTLTAARPERAEEADKCNWRFR